LHVPLQPASASAAVIAALRNAGGRPSGTDSWLAPEIEIAVELVAGGGAVTAVESVTGPIN
jgi:histidine ammonia-lyase